ncbi:MAG: SDR family oxidoreductase [Chloroflexi bacterium]|nr:SDR family oxidoreductase [Chloroflexota bacterium]MBT4001883.1 SDR family oxidoreductase [Chloroflexota bacterium]MBT4305625.1 SDR family oxidoreductase [Chloroflexota bacterium]MBT4535023.1 SDR family oxidoreductase [Chloroflexota bacterium]MBT4683975.1 SDR family oxidoreductase [Chloroflexota bacterium]
MNIVVFGATGKTGMEVVSQGLEQGHIVTAFVRDPIKISIDHKNLRIIEGNIFDDFSVAKTIKGQEAVICSLGSSELSKTDIRSKGTSIIIKAMNSNNVKRLFVVSAMGVAESWSTLSFMGRLIFATLLSASKKDHEAQEKYVRESDLDWTIFRPSGLNDNPMTGEYILGENAAAVTSQIPRADVAHAILSEINENKYVKKAVTITN